MVEAIKLLEKFFPYNVLRVQGWSVLCDPLWFMDVGFFDVETIGSFLVKILKLTC